MTDRVIRIIVDPSGVDSGTRRIRNQLGSIDRSAAGTRQSLNSLAQAAGLVIGAFGIRELVRIADGYTNLQNRLRLVTDSTAELNAVQDELVGLAQRTRTGLDSVSRLYARTARSTEALGLTQREVLDVTESVSQALQISGASASEASAGVVQFTQGLAGGIVRAEEFNSIIEQTPRLAEAIAEGLGISIGELRRRVVEGELEAQAVIEAIQNEAGTLREEFSRITPTVEATATTIGNFVTVAVGGFNEAAGVTEGLVEIFQLTDEETKALAETVRDLGLSFREFVEVAVVAVANFAEQVPARFARFRADIAGTLGVIFGNDAVVEAAIEDRQALEVEIARIQARLDEEFEIIRRNSEARREGLENRAADLNRERGDGGGGGAPEIDQETIDKQAEFISGLEQQAAELAIQSSLLDESEGTLLRYRTAIEAAALGDAEFVDRALELADAINEQATALERAENIAADRDLVAGLEDELELLGLTNRERAIEIELRNLSADATDEQRQAVRDLVGAIFDQEEALRNQTDFLENIAEQAASNIQDAFADFLFDPFDDGLEGLVANFADALRRMASEALAAEIFGSLFGGQDAGGGLGSLLGSFLGQRATGGSVQGGSPVVVGEEGPEIFRPPTGGNIVPAAPTASMMAPQVSVPVQVINVRDPSEIPAAMQTAAGREVILNAIREEPDAVREIIR